MATISLNTPPERPLRIRCAVCNRQVDRYEWWMSPYTMTRTLIVHCHGDNDRMTLSDLDMAEMGRDELDRMAASEGVAFTTKRLGVPAPSLSAGESGR